MRRVPVMIGENCCIFAGKIRSVKSYKGESDHGPWVMARFELLLCTESGHSQSISLIAWNSLAERVLELEEGKNIKVLSWYNPSEFRGKLQDTFQVDSFVVLENE